MPVDVVAAPDTVEFEAEGLDQALCVGEPDVGQLAVGQPVE